MPNTPDMVITKSIQLDGQHVEYRVRRNARARRIWIRLEEGEGLVVVFPRWGSLSTAAELLRRNKEWVLQAIKKHEERMAIAPPPLGKGRTLMYRGRIMGLRVQSVACPGPAVKFSRGEFIVRLPNSESPVGEVLETWYRQRAEVVIGRRVAYFAKRLGLKPKKVAVKNQKSRWGSCSSNGGLNFNWRLLLAPPGVLDYVVIHELCHMRHPDHSERFWALVSRYCPFFGKYRGWLQEYGPLLRA